MDMNHDNAPEVDNINPDEVRAEKLGYPPALVKACVDAFSYALRLRTGEVWVFHEARAVSYDWVHLILVEPVVGDDGEGQTKDRPWYLRDGNLFDRGVDVRVSDIVWVADCPEGS